MTIKKLDGDKVAVSAEAMQKVSATLPHYTVDEIALDASRIIMHAVRGGPMIGGDTQLQARIQCVVIEAIESVSAARPWTYRRYGSPPDKGYTITYADRLHNQEPIAFIGDSDIAQKAADAICDAHNHFIGIAKISDATAQGKLANWQPPETAPIDEEILVIATLYSMIYPEPQRVVAKKDSGNSWWAGPIPLSHVTKWMHLPETPPCGS